MYDLDFWFLITNYLTNNTSQPVLCTIIFINDKKLEIQININYIVKIKIV